MKKVIALVGVVGLCGLLWYGYGCTKADTPETLTEETIEVEEIVPMLEVPAPEKVAPEADKAAGEGEEKK